MRSPPLVSVIVPVYCVEQYLERCVHSIETQSYRNLEIILVDDGSPDMCPAMCDAWARKDTRIHVIHQSNMGLADARNHGLDAATGDYVFFVDSDDHIDQETIERLVMAAVKNGCDIVQMGFTWEWSDGRRQQREVLPFSLESRESVMDGFLGICAGRENPHVLNYAWGKLYRRELWDDLRFPSGVDYEDMAVMPAVCLKCSHVVGLAEYGYYYNQSNNNAITRRHTHRTIASLCLQPTIWEKHFADWPMYRPYAEERYCRLAIKVLQDLKAENADALFKEYAPRLISVFRKHFGCWRKSKAWKRRAIQRKLGFWLFEVWPGAYFFALQLFLRARRK